MSVSILKYTDNCANNCFDLRGLSTDAKPTDGIPNGSTFIEIDTGKVYMFDSVGNEWAEV